MARWQRAVRAKFLRTICSFIITARGSKQYSSDKTVVYFLPQILQSGSVSSRLKSLLVHTLEAKLLTIFKIVSSFVGGWRARRLCQLVHDYPANSTQTRRTICSACAASHFRFRLRLRLRLRPRLWVIDVSGLHWRHGARWEQSSAVCGRGRSLIAMCFNRNGIQMRWRMVVNPFAQVAQEEAGALRKIVVSRLCLYCIQWFVHEWRIQWSP